MSRTVEITPVEGGASLMVAWRLEGRRVLVVGGGAVAAGRVRLALEADARVTVVAPRLGAELTRRAKHGEIDWHARRFTDVDLDEIDLALSAVDDPKVSRRVARLSRAAKIPVNVADVPDLCDFWFTSVFRDGPLQISVSSGGKGPSIAARLVRELGGGLPKSIGRSVERFGELRQAIRRSDSSSSPSPRRMAWLAEIGRSWSYGELASLDAKKIRTLESAYQSGASAPQTPPQAEPRRPRSRTPGHGRVRLIGAGPGDPELLTQAARRAIEDADLVVADRIVPPEVLALVRCELRVARKLKGVAEAAQAEIETWVIEAAREGKDVVRLKAGDSMIYGRAGEELEVFSWAGLDTQIIPGVSSVVAAPARANIPLTMRGVADRFTVLTGYGAAGRWPSLPAFDSQETLVVLMGVGRAGAIAERLQKKDFPPSWPVAIVERATHPDERVTHTSLGELGTTIERASIRAPAVIIIGRVTELPGRLGAAQEERARGAA